MCSHVKFRFSFQGFDVSLSFLKMKSNYLNTRYLFILFSYWSDILLKRVVEQIQKLRHDRFGIYDEFIFILNETSKNL